jgi:hypothetical protein
MAQEELQEETRTEAMTLFLHARVEEGYAIETRTDTHAIIARARGWSWRSPFSKSSDRLVVQVDDGGEVTVRPAEPLRS